MSVKSCLVPRIATIEIPVSNLKAAIDWYEKLLGLELIDEHKEFAQEAMMRFSEHSVGVPTLFLVQTDSEERLKFHNTNHGYTQSVIDFYTPDLGAFHRHLKSNGVTTNRELVELKQGEISGFGFFDLDGNSFGATNAVSATPQIN